MHRRRFLLHSAAAAAGLAAALPEPLRELFASEASGRDTKISAIDVLRATGRIMRRVGVNRQYQVKPSHLYGPPPVYHEEGEGELAPQRASRLFVRVRTSGGAEGWYGAVDSDALPFILGPLRRVVLGRDALAVETLWDMMYRADRFGRFGRYMKGVSYIDNALWDLRGRVFGSPVHQLLGGPTRDVVKVYGSCLGFSVEPAKAAERAVILKELGFSHQKWFFAYGPASGADGLQRNVELVRSLRAAVGEKTQLLFDAFQGWDLQYALAWAGRVEPQRPYWIEEAFPVGDLESFIRFSRRTSIPVATGEHFANRWEVQQFLKADCLQYVQADPEWCGGVSELVKICHLASVHGVKVVPHGHNIHAAMHVVLSQSPAVCPLVEYLINSVPSKMAFQKDPPLTNNGLLPVPTKPGFGIELDEEAIEELEVITQAS